MKKEEIKNAEQLNIPPARQARNTENSDMSIINLREGKEEIKNAEQLNIPPARQARNKENSDMNNKNLREGHVYKLMVAWAVLSMLIEISLFGCQVYCDITHRNTLSQLIFAISLLIMPFFLYVEIHLSAYRDDAVLIDKLKQLTKGQSKNNVKK